MQESINIIFNQHRIEDDNYLYISFDIWRLCMKIINQWFVDSSM